MQIVMNKKTKVVQLAHTDALTVNDQWSIICGLSFDLLSSGNYAVRPSCGLGTVGWHPFSWGCVLHKNPTKGALLFLERHKKVILNTFK